MLLLTAFPDRLQARRIRSLRPHEAHRAKRSGPGHATAPASLLAPAAALVSMLLPATAPAWLLALAAALAQAPALLPAAALAQGYDREDMVRGLCQKDGCDEFAI